MAEQFAVQGALKLKDKTGTTLSGIKNKFSSAIKAITKLAMGIGVAMAGAATASIQSAAKFESATLRIIAATTATGEEAVALRKSLEDAARVLGIEFGSGATAAMEALESLVKAGLEGEEAIDALSGALTLAKLEGIDTATASNLLVQAMTMFGIEAKDATQIIDAMSAASDLGISTATGYASGLSNVGATAANMGLSMEETLAALVQMDNTFGDVQSSGTFLNRMLLQMAEKAEEAGIELYNADGSMVSLDEIMVQVRTTLEGFGSDQEKVNEWLGQFDVRAQRALVALSNYDESIGETEDSMDEMRSSAEKLDIVMDSFSGQMSILRAKSEDTAIAIGETLMPYAMDFLNWVQDILPDVENLIIQFKDVAKEVWAFAQNLMNGEWGTAYEKIQELYGNIESKFMEWWNAINWEAVWSGLKTFSGDLWAWMTKAAGNISEAFITWWKTIDWAAVWNQLATWATSLFGMIQYWAGNISEAFITWWKTIDWAAVWSQLETFTGDLWKKLTTWAGDISKAFLEWFGEIKWDAVFLKAGEFMDDFFPWLWGKAGDIAYAFKDWANQIDWATVFTKLAAFALKLPAWISAQILKAPITLGVHLAKWVESEIPDMAKGFDMLVTEVRAKVTDALKGAANKILSWMPDWLKKMLGIKAMDVPDEPTAPPPYDPPSNAPPTPDPTPSPPPSGGDGDTKVETYRGIPIYRTASGLYRSNAAVYLRHSPADCRKDIDNYLGSYQDPGQRLAGGGEFVTKGPTSIMVGEAGPEKVQVSPLHGGGGAAADLGGGRGDIIMNFPEINSFPENSVMAEALASIVLTRMDRRRYRRGRWTT